VAFLVEPKARFGWIRPILSILVLLFGIVFITHKEPYTWGSYFAKAAASRAERTGYLNRTREVIDFCRGNIPQGAVVLTDEWSGMVLTMVHDCHIVAPKRGGNGIVDWRQRREDVRIMLALETPWETRRALLRKYDVQYFFPAGSPAEWVQGHLKAYPTNRRFPLYTLDTGQ